MCVCEYAQSMENLQNSIYCEYQCYAMVNVMDRKAIPKNYNKRTMNEEH